MHDWLNQVGGAENVLEILVRMFPGAPVFTSMYARDRMPAAYRAWDIRTTFMQHLPGVTRKHQVYMPVYPLAFSRVDSDRIRPDSQQQERLLPRRTDAGGRRPCLLLSDADALPVAVRGLPAREALGKGVDLALRPLLGPLRRWDYAAAQRVHHFIAISREIQERIRRFYGRDSTIIYPPVDLKRFTPSCRCARRLLPGRRPADPLQADRSGGAGLF